MEIFLLRSGEMTFEQASLLLCVVCGIVVGILVLYVIMAFWFE